MWNVRSDKATVHFGGLAGDADEDILFELGTQFGVVKRVTIPRDKLSGTREDFAFIEFATPADAKYCADVLTRAPIELYGKRLRVSYKGDVAGGMDSLLEIGAKLCIRNMDVSVDEAALATHFEQFGKFAVPPRVLRDDNGLSKGVGFVSYDSFEAADAAIAAMNNRWLANRLIAVDFAERSDGRGRHGTEEERRMYAAGGGVQGAAPPPDAKPAVSATPAWAMGLPNPVKARVVE